MLGSELNFSTSFHPQTDGQTERINNLLEMYRSVGHFVSANQHNWVKLLDVAQFSYNLQKSESSGASPFEITTGQQPLTPQTLALPYSGRSPGAFLMAKEWSEQAEVARAYLTKAAKRMKKWADMKRRPREFTEGDLVMVKLQPHIYRQCGKVNRSLLRKYEGPFEVVKRVGKGAYRLALPAHLELHPVFHVSFLKPYHGDDEDPERGISKRAPPRIGAVLEREVEEILAHRQKRAKGVRTNITEYLNAETTSGGQICENVFIP